MSLVSRVALRLATGATMLGGALFASAGTFRYWEAWLYLGVVFVPASVVSFVLIVTDRALLERRMRMHERETTQRRIVVAASLLVMALYVMAGLDRRYAWSTVSPAFVAIADAVVLMSFGVFVWTLRANRFASRVIEVQAGQVVVTTGPYAIVRHPMYGGACIMFVSSPVALGSYWALAPACLLPVLLAARIGNEEDLLRRDLAGYVDYCERVRYRLVPFVW